jgi:uncharacterized protein YhaN
MKIERLALKAFGCFRDFSLDLGSSEPGMFVIYGVNEAGKSTALQAIRQWIYEFDRNVALDFYHKKSKQRVGGELSWNGQRLSCFRKRGNANTLLDDVDQPIGDDALRPYLQGIDEQRFRTIFGINHASLREGGRNIAAGKGDLGQALFAAGSGLLHLDRILRRLTAAKDAVFAVRGERPVINRCLLRCEEIKARKAQARLPLADIEDQQRKLDELNIQCQKRWTELRAIEQQRDEIDRLIRVTPLVKRRELLKQQLADLSEAKHLRSDFRGDFQRIDGELLKKSNGLQLLREQLAKVEMELKQIPSDPEVLREQDALRKLSKQAGTYETDSKDRPGLQREHNLIQGEAKQKLRALGREPDLTIEAIEPLRLDEQERNRIRDLGTKRAEVFTKAENARRKVAELELEQRGTEEDLKQLSIPISTESLSVTLQRITKKGDLEKGVEDARRTVAEAERALKQALSQLPLWAGDLEQIANAKIPAVAQVDHHRDQIETVRGRLQEANRVSGEIANSIIDLNSQRERLRLAGEVPTEEDLEAERTRRQRGWCLIRSAWLNGKRDEVAAAAWIADVKPGASLADAYEASVLSSDHIADRLRREANRVSEQARLLADESAARKKSEAANVDAQLEEAALRAAENEWRAIWRDAGIQPRSPKEMRLWLDQWEKLVQQANQRQSAVAAWERATAEREESIHDIRSALHACHCLPSSLRSDVSLGELLELTQTRITEADELRQNRQSLETDLRRIRRDLGKAKLELSAAEQKNVEWEKQWDTALSFLGERQRLSPEEANRILDMLLDFWKKINDLKNRQSRLEGIDKRSGGFPQAVADLAERLEGKCPDSEEPLRVHERLQARLNDADLNEKQRREKERAGVDLQGKIRDEEETIQLLQQQLHRLCQEAAVDDPAELPEAMRCSDELREVTSKFEQCETDLQLQGGVAALEGLCKLVFEAEAQHRDFDQERSPLEQQLKEKRVQLEEVTKQIGAVEETLKGLRARSGMGEVVAEEESEYAQLRGGVENFATLVLASCVLTEAISRYREGNSSGLLAEASTLFRRLTCGSFERLAISEDEDGHPFLIGVRPDGSEVQVEGMSDGTCDQLYLSLRLAHLKRHVAKEGPFPFIVDDILVAFDNERARAALSCLADLGTCTQVLLFTHHRHIRDMAAGAEFSTKIVIQDLP